MTLRMATVTAVQSDKHLGKWGHGSGAKLPKRRLDHKQPHLHKRVCCVVRTTWQVAASERSELNGIGAGCVVSQNCNGAVAGERKCRWLSTRCVGRGVTSGDRRR
jgi:hypothetical protein